MEKEIKISDPARGVKLCVLPADRFKTSIVSVTLAMPLCGNIEARAVLAYLLRRCSAKYQNLTEMNRRLAELYGAILSSGVSKKGEAQLVSLSITSVNDRFALQNENISEECTKLLLDLLFEPKLENGVFSEENVELEKRLLIEKMNGDFSDKRTYALMRATEEMCKNELYGSRSYGTAEKVKALTAEAITDEWKNMLSSALIQFNIVGSGSSNIENVIRERFSSIDRSNLCKIRTEFVTSASDENYIEEKQAVKQGKLVIGLRAGMTYEDDNNYVLHVMTDIFGGGPYSKLFMNVREKMSLCYYCSARFVRMKGIIMIQSGIEEENEEKAITAIKKQLEDMQKGNFSVEDFSNSVKGISDMYLSVEDTPEGIDDWYSGQYLTLGKEKFISPAQYVENIRKVTPEQVRAAAMNVTVDTVYMLKSNGEGGDEDED